MPQLRGRRIADLVEAQPELTPAETAARLGYPAITHRGAPTIAEAELRSRRARTYLRRDDGDPRWRRGGTPRTLHQLRGVLDRGRRRRGGVIAEFTGPPPC
ncbi:hypothetical protein ACGFMM_24885 [Streptomyces sp. NPDC048604]|uniref:hypothetical protein n=1 Tax=Streptomyces sp. NPDC048604 TaxID=3365578 RepID=UPI0037121B85